MSTEYKIVDNGQYPLLVTTHGGKLDLDVETDEGYLTIASLEPLELAKVGLRLLEVAMLNDYSGEGCTIDVPAFKKWIHEQIKEL